MRDADLVQPQSAISRRSKSALRPERADDRYWDVADWLEDNAFHVARRPKRPETVDLTIVRQAMRDQHKLSIVYRDPRGVKTTRIIWPIAVAFFDTRRIIAGWCEMRKGFRSFRADRIEKIKPLTSRYPGRRRDLVKQWRTQVDAERREGVE